MVGNFLLECILRPCSSGFTGLFKIFSSSIPGHEVLVPHKTSRKYALLLGKDPSLVMKIGSLEEANWQFLHYHEKLA